MSFFKHIEQLPEDSILSLPIAFGADVRPFKVNLGIGSYKTADGHPFVLESVKKGEAELLKKNLNKEYLPIIGDEEFLNCSLKLLFGSDLDPLKGSHYFTAQTVGGSGALRVAGEFIARNLAQSIFIPDLSWPNHFLIFERSPIQVESYPYIDPTTHRLDFSGICEKIKKIPPKNAILLHACCHNPTGIGPSPEQWKELSDLIKAKNLLPFFDIAYQGFGRGMEQDAWPIHHFAQEGHEMMIAYSFAKNFGLYGERVGFLTIVNSQQNLIVKIASQIKTIVRSIYSTPPLHGERIVKTI